MLLSTKSLSCSSSFHPEATNLRQPLHRELSGGGLYTGAVRGQPLHGSYPNAASTPGAAPGYKLYTGSWPGAASTRELSRDILFTGAFRGSLYCRAVQGAVSTLELPRGCFYMGAVRVQPYKRSCTGEAEQSLLESSPRKCNLLTTGQMMPLALSLTAVFMSYVSLQ